MYKLLSAGFARLKKDSFFWIGMIFMFVIGVACPAALYLDEIKYDCHIPFESCFFSYVIFSAILSSVFCSLFIGTEYSEGTIRNKLIMGHKRSDIYLSNLILCIATCSLMSIAYLIPYSLVGIPLLGSFTVDFRLILAYMGCIFVLSITFAAIFSMAAMLRQNRAVTAIICLLSVFSLLFLAAYLDARLGEPEYHDYYIYTNETDMEERSQEPNPYYLKGAKREVCEFFQDFLPGGQALQLSSLSDDIHMKRMVLYSCIITVLSAGTGIYFFKKKDIK